jgi:hypothetical protein
VICNKICKRIQESDFVIADISLPNPNVFYELGLAYGLRQKIVLIHHEKSDFGKRTADDLKAKAYTYKDLAPIQPKDFPLSQYIWPMTSPEMPHHGVPQVLVVHLEEEAVKPPEDDIALDFTTHVCAAVGVSIFEIEKKLTDDEIPLAAYRDQVRELRTARVIARGTSFQDLAAQIRSSFCTIIKTGGKKRKPTSPETGDSGDASRPEPMTYFWLGYCHAIGRNVIPVAVLDKEGEDLEDLAFDIRALWHMTFYRSQANRFAPQLQDTLHQMIVTDFSEWSRKRFWDQVLAKPDEVSIFTGALHIEQFSREMVGDWDLRSVSELTSYLASHQCRARIESPVYQVKPEFLTGENKEGFVDELIGLLRNKNCILIASPDVNPLTEIVLGAVYGIPRSEWFTNSKAADRTPSAVVAFKRKAKPVGTSSDGANAEFAFYRDTYVNEGEAPQRGFRSQILTGGVVMEEFVSQTETDKMRQFHVYGHLLIAPNPFRDKGSDRKYIIVLNGISGPATFALTQVLTGGVSTEFVSYTGFKPKSEAEAAVQKITEDLAMMTRGDFAGVQYIYDVTVGPPPDVVSGGASASQSHKTYDWRRVIRWDRIEASDGAFQLTTRVRSKAASVNPSA